MMTRAEKNKRLKEDRVYFGQNLMIDQRTGERVRFWDFQKEDLLSQSRKIIHKDGRETGKTEMVLPCRATHSFSRPRRKTLLIAPQETHLVKALTAIEYQLRSELLSGTFNGVIKRKPHYVIVFNNGHVFNAAVAGPRGDQLRGFHADTVIIDEAALMTEQAWAAAGGCINEGAEQAIYGVPTGVRSNNYYRFTTDGTYELHHCPSWLAPTFTDEKRQEKLDFYGGENTPEFQHEVAGEHGSPTFGVYNPEDMAKGLINYPYLKLSLCGDDLASFDKSTIIGNIVKQIKDHCSDKPIYIGADLGYSSDPAEITFHEERGMNIRTLARLHLEHVKYTDQIIIIKALYETLNLLGIGIDNGNNGLAVCQTLTEDIPAIIFKLEPVNFGGTTLIDPVQGIKEYNKKFMTTLQLGAIQRGEWEIPGVNGSFADQDFECQYSEHTYTTVGDGRVTYKKGNDHIIDADRCAFYVRWKLSQREGNGGFYF
jgi:hypothetical protein